MENKYFTKSVFKRALECPTSIFYLNKSNEYINNEINNDFVKSLMEGGYQVEYLARDYYPDGIDLSNLSVEDNVEKTKELILNNTNVIIFQPTFEFDGFLVRSDIIEKVGDTLKIMEIKAKGFDFQNDGVMTFVNSRTLKSDNPQLKKDWASYVLDVAFQKFVISMIYNLNIESYLYMMDKNAKVTVDGLHQKYLIKENNKVEIKDGPVGEPIMNMIQIDEVFDIIHLFSDSHRNFNGMSFIRFVEFVKENYLSDDMIPPVIGSFCKNCPFYTTEENDKVKSGFLNCWSMVTNLPKKEIQNNPTILDIWNYRKKDDMISEKVFLIKDFKDYDNLKVKGNGSFDTSDRQSIQIKKVIDKDQTIAVYDKSLRKEMDKWVFPLNMIDFETTSVAIPFNIHLKPYESLAYQFSHHVIYEDGHVEHKSEYLHGIQGEFPSFEFIRKLKESLETNRGSVFMYSPHENSILNHILRQLCSPLGDTQTDKNELISFIKTITVSNSKTLSEFGLDLTPWCGDRAMIDMWAILKDYYYNPLTNGSNSIKYVLPAILNSSDYLKNKYSKPIYGTDEMPSHNYKNHTWIKFDENGMVINPYKLLPPLFENIDDQSFITSERLANGGDAMVAYAKLQFTQMGDTERKAVMNGLLKYCELDTLAMVMLFEHWWYDIISK